MDKIKNYCSACGAELQIDDSATLGKCMRCGTQFLVDNSHKMSYADYLESIAQSKASNQGEKLAQLKEKAHISLEHNNWGLATEYFKEIIKIDRKNSDAYLGVYLAEMKCESEISLSQRVDINNIKENPNIQNALKFADTTSQLEQIMQTVQDNYIAEQERIEIEKREKIINNRKSQHLCQHCGGKFKGVFTKICIECNQKKDY